MTRRERWSVLAAILDALKDETSTMGKDVRLTVVSKRANVPYDRLALYLADLARLGLITEEKTPRLTPKGEEFLQHYTHFSRVLDRFGLG